jgi:transposase InsO family protein
MRPRPQPSNALTQIERQAALETLNSDMYADLAPAQVFAKLLDDGTYLGSLRTLYRILGENDQVRERRAVLRHPSYVKPQLVATAPNQVWSWDITKLAGSAKGIWFHLYVVLDIFSRYVVGWLIAPHESSQLAQHLMQESCRKHAIEPGQLKLHADRGTAMRSKGLGQLLADLGVDKSFSRPRVSDDNPYSESQFKTIKYRPGFPERFGSIEHAESECRNLINWYNTEHQHSGIAYLTPAQVHYGQAPTILLERQLVMDEAYARNPERFRRHPIVAKLRSSVWINDRRCPTQR